MTIGESEAVAATLDGGTFSASIDTSALTNSATKRVRAFVPDSSPFTSAAAIVNLSNAGASSLDPAYVANQFIDLNALDDAGLAAAGWTATGGGSRLGTLITCVGNCLYFTRRDLDLSQRQAWLIEAVVSATPCTSAGTRGVQLWAKFYDSDAPMIPPLFPHLRQIQACLYDDGLGNRRISLWDDAAGLELASLSVNWSEATPRYRIRLKRQRISGTDYIVLQAEPSNTLDDPQNPNPVPDTATSVKVSLASFSVSTGNYSEVGWGSFVPGTYDACWENIHITCANDPDRPLPYRPLTPPAPALTRMSAGDGIGIAFDLDLGWPPLALPYASSDVATLSLVHDGGTISSTVVDPSNANAGLHHIDFSGIADDQTVTGTVVIADASGRISAVSAANLAIPPR